LLSLSRSRARRQAEQSSNGRTESADREHQGDIRGM